MIASTPAADMSAPACRSDCSSLAAPLAQTLRELHALVDSLSPRLYTLRAGEAFSGSTIGAHIRHCLDHVRALADGWRTGAVDYDHRARGTSIETDPAHAAAEILRLIASIDRLALLDANDGLRVAVMPTRDGATVLLSSTLARELAFLLSHTVHHSALIRAMLLSIPAESGAADARQEVGGISRVSPSFGFAPSTLAHHDQSEREHGAAPVSTSGIDACAR